jgi:hypothetical protein
MSVEVHAATPSRWGRRVVTRLALLAAVGATFAFILLQLLAATTADRSSVDSERRGVAYLQPLNHLIGELAEAQSITVRGQPVDATKINTAIAGVDAADHEHGESLDARQRWVDLRQGIGTVTGRSLSGEAAYVAYSDLITLALELGRKVGDTSELILDPELDSYYLMDTVLLRVPQVLVSAGRAADLAVLAGPAPPTAAQVRVSVARYQVAADAAAVGIGLRKAMESTNSATLAPNVTGQLDEFRSAVDAFAASATLLPPVDTVDADTLTRNAERVRQEARPLGNAVLSELDGLLRDRHDDLTVQRVTAIVAGAGGVLLAIVLLAVLLPPPPRTAPADHGGEGEIEQRDERVEPEDPELADTTFVDPRDLLAVEELLHVGRAVRARRRERVDDAR